MRDGQQRKMPFLPGGVLRSLRFCLEEEAGTRNYLVMSAASDFSAAKPVTVGELGSGVSPGHCCQRKGYLRMCVRHLVYTNNNISQVSTHFSLQ